MSGNVNQVRSARESIINKNALIELCALMSTSAFLRNIIENDRRELDQIKKELAVTEEAQLHIRRRGDRFEFACKPKHASREIGISKEKDRIYQLARRAIIEDRKKLIELRLKRLQRVADSCDEAKNEERLARKLGRYCSAGIDPCRILFTEEQNEWIDQNYTPNPFHPEDLINATNGGIRMRSKSETRIGNRAEQFGLPFRYDDFVTIHDPKGRRFHSHEDGPFRASYFADFKFPNLLGGITIHEHIGAFQIDNYGDNSLKRLNDYHNFQVIELDGKLVKHEEITWSFENDVINAKTIDKLLAKVLLPGLF